MIKSSDILTRAEIWQLRQKSNLKGLWLIFHAWAVIIASMIAYIIWPNTWVLLVGVFVVGARQLGLAILMHDASHGLLLANRKANDLLGNILCAWPAGINLGEYRPYHMLHHRYTQQAKDPDLILSDPFPITKASLYRKIARDLFGLTFSRLRFLQIVAAWGGKELGLFEHISHFTKSMGGIIGLNVFILFICASFGVGHVYFLLWLLPLATSYQLVARIRNIAEHAMVPDNKDDYRNTRTTKANIFARIFIAPYWVNYHIEHHLFVFSPCYNLKAANKMMQEKALVDKMEIRDNYKDVLKLASSA